MPDNVSTLLYKISCAHNEGERSNRSQWPTKGHPIGCHNTRLQQDLDGIFFAHYPKKHQLHTMINYFTFICRPFSFLTIWTLHKFTFCTSSLLHLSLGNFGPIKMRTESTSRNFNVYFHGTLCPWRNPPWKEEASYTYSFKCGMVLRPM